METSTSSSLVVSGLPTDVRLEAPSELFVGSWLRARLVLTVSAAHAAEQPEWRTLFDDIRCRPSLMTAEGSVLLPIGAQQERRNEATGVTIDIHMHIVNLNLSSPGMVPPPSRMPPRPAPRQSRTSPTHPAFINSAPAPANPPYPACRT